MPSFLYTTAGAGFKVCIYLQPALPSTVEGRTPEKGSNPPLYYTAVEECVRQPFCSHCPLPSNVEVSVEFKPSYTLA